MLVSEFCWTETRLYSSFPCGELSQHDYDDGAISVTVDLHWCSPNQKISNFLIVDWKGETAQKVSDYDQEITTITHCRPIHDTVRKSQRTITVTRHIKDIKKATSSLFLELIRYYKRHKVMHTKTKTNIVPPQTLGGTYNNKTTTTEPPP